MINYYGLKAYSLIFILAGGITPNLHLVFFLSR